MNKIPENTSSQLYKKIIEDGMALNKDGMALNKDLSFNQVANSERVAAVLAESEFFNLDDRI